MYWADDAGQSVLAFILCYFFLYIFFEYIFFKLLIIMKIKYKTRIVALGLPLGLECE